MSSSFFQLLWDYNASDSKRLSWAGNCWGFAIGTWAALLARQVSAHSSGFRASTSLASAGAVTSYRSWCTHLLRGGSKQHVGRAEFCCPRMRGGVRLVPARGRIWLGKKAQRELWQARTTVFAGTKETCDDCCFQEDLSHLSKPDTDTRCSGFFNKHASSPLWHGQVENRTAGTTYFANAWRCPSITTPKDLSFFLCQSLFAIRALVRLLQWSQRKSLCHAKGKAPSISHTQRLRR